MNLRSVFPKSAMISFAIFVVSMTLIAAEEPADATKVPNTTPIPAAEARRQAELLHEAFHATLQTIHHQYYRNDQGMTVPAVTMKSVFRELEERRKIEIRWLAVNAQAMNIDHQPKTDFEKDAAKALSAGAEQFEVVDGNVYRHVGAILLQSECLKCDLPNRTSNKSRLAALLISIPLQGKQ
jgi:hypothetical protein